jgi:hypothetical protein
MFAQCLADGELPGEQFGRSSEMLAGQRDQPAQRAQIPRSRIDVRIEPEPN